MSVIVNFTSSGNPPHNITGFNIERSVRTGTGTIANAGAINNTTKVISVTFSGTALSDASLIGDQMHINGVLYNIVTNTSNTISFALDSDLSTISSFPATFVVINDLAEFGDFEIVGSVTPTVPFATSFVHQYVDTTGTIFDFYRVKSVDSGGSVSVSPLTTPFRVGQVVNLALDQKRLIPQDSLKGCILGSITFEVTLILGGRRQDPSNHVVMADIFCPSYIAPNGIMTKINSILMQRVGLAQYRATWIIPTAVGEEWGGITIYPSDDYIVSYKANFRGIVTTAPNALMEFASEFFTITSFDAPVFGRFPACATIDDLRLTFFEIDAYLPESIRSTDVESRNSILQFHLERASDKLREELNIHQVRSNSADRQEYVCSRAIYTLFMAARGQNAASISNELLEMWRTRAEYILAQLKREGIAQGLPLGRG